MSSNNNIWLWIVGSQVGYMDRVDDCVIHGVFNTEAHAQTCIDKLQFENPGDAYCVLRVKLNSTINVGFSMASQWSWHDGKDVSKDIQDAECYRCAFSEPTNIIAK